MTRRTRTVGLVLSDITDPYFHEIAKGVEAVLSEAGYALILADTDHSTEKEIRSLEIFHSQQVAGVILAGSGMTGSEEEQHLLQLEKADVAVVTLGRHRLGLPFVAVDNAEAAFIAATYLIETGCRRIAFVAGPPGLLAAEERRQGYIRALERHGLPFEPRWVVCGDFTPAGGFRAIKELLDVVAGEPAARRPDAVVAANDQMAIGVLKGLKEHRIAVPEEMAVVGIGGIPTGEFVDPPLTTVALPMKGMGEAAAQMLIDRIEDACQTREEIWLETRLLVRSSTRGGNRAWR